MDVFVRVAVQEHPGQISTLATSNFYITLLQRDDAQLL